MKLKYVGIAIGLIMLVWFVISAENDPISSAIGAALSGFSIGIAIGYLILEKIEKQINDLLDE